MEKETQNTESEQATAQAFDEMLQIQLRTWKHLSDVQMKFVNLWQEYLNSSFQRVPSARSVSDLVAIESGLSAEFGNRFSECSNEAIEAISTAQQEILSCLNRDTGNRKRAAG